MMLRHTVRFPKQEADKANGHEGGSCCQFTRLSTNFQACEAGFLPRCRKGRGAMTGCHNFGLSNSSTLTRVESALQTSTSYRVNSSNIRATGTSSSAVVTPASDAGVTGGKAFLVADPTLSSNVNVSDFNT